MSDKPEVMDKGTLKALSTDTRQTILKFLSKRPYTASELSKLLDKHVTTVTEHLSVLEKSSVVRRKESTNKWVYYTLTDKGEKLFKPYYSWIVLLSISVLIFVVGLYEITFVSFQTSAYSISEKAAIQQTGQAAPSLAQTAAVESSSMNIYIGVVILAVALVILWMAMRQRKKHFAEKVRIYQTMMQL